MKAGKPIYVGFLWHMHQPWYLWDEEGEAALPWTRLHALKDYYDMPLLMAQHGFPGTINLVPSLLKQIELLAAGRATDPFWEAFVTDVDDLNEAQLSLIVSRFFDVNFERFIKPSERYRELFGKRGASADWRVFSRQEIRDTQVHFMLAWLGQSLKEKPEIKELLEKDRDYTVADKEVIVQVATERLREIIPLYGKLAREGHIRLTFSPFYHPILPLLCDVVVARKANPLTRLPKKPFIYPGDAERQIRLGIEYFSTLFGIRPDGMWPPEGGVAEEILTLLAEAGIRYTFSDEDILRKSLEASLGEPAELTPQKLYMPYNIFRGGKSITFFFRDKRLSDKIGFVYYKHDEREAVDDFVNSLLRIRDALPDDERNYIVSVILDGENAWEYYRENGKPFLSMLYDALLDHSEIEPITFCDFLDLGGEIPFLDRLAPGSWINGDFSTWCGAEEKNAAWELLSDARNNFQLNADKVPPALREKIMHHIMVAEGSDWFWWFGETDYTPYLEAFDELFRSHLRKVYQLLGEAVPPELETPIQATERPFKPVRMPLQFMTPSLEGKATTYFEWSAAGFYKATGFRGAMYDARSQIIEGLYFGFDLENLYLRLDSSKLLSDFLRKGGKFLFEFLAPKRIDLEVFCEGGTITWKAFEVEGNRRKPTELSGVKVVCEQICELKLPFASFGATPEKPLRFVVYVQEDSMLEQRFPPGGQYIEIEPPDADFEDRMWYV